jgi:lipoprotein-releasing system permease protein
MRFELYLALRSLRARVLSRFLSFMTLVAVGSVAVGVAALIIAFTVLDGFERELRENLIGFSAHIQMGVFRDAVLEPSSATERRIAAVPNVARLSPYLEREAVALTRGNLEGVRVKGLDADHDISRLRDRMVGGRYMLRPADGRPSVVIGRRLAGKLHLKVGDRLLLVGVTDARHALDAPKVQCTVRGLYETGMSEYLDDIYVFTDLPTARRVFGLPGMIGGYDVLCRDPGRVEQTVEALRTSVGYPFDPRSVFSLFRNLFVWIDLQQELIPVVVGSLIVISVFNIIATLLLFVIEKTEQIGVLLALGARTGSVRRVFMFQGAVIGAAGALAGAALAFAFCYAQQELRFFRLPQDVYFMTAVPIDLRVTVFAGVTLAAVALAFLSSAVPAWMASRLNPVTSIRFR